MNKKSIFITAGSSAIVLGMFLFYFGNEERYSTYSGDTFSLIAGIVLLVAGVGSLSFGFTIKAD